MPQATVKSYDSLTKTGTLISDDHETTYEIEPQMIEESMFRFLRPGQRVTFDIVEIEGRKRLRNLRIGLA
jgi:cold shock CspA family protein